MQKAPEAEASEPPELVQGNFSRLTKWGSASQPCLVRPVRVLMPRDGSVVQ